jgi:uncharacterized protein YifE (UPF0438 family)
MRLASREGRMPRRFTKHGDYTVLQFSFNEHGF